MEAWQLGQALGSAMISSRHASTPFSPQYSALSAHSDNFLKKHRSPARSMFWWANRGSEPGTTWIQESGALPTELLAHRWSG